MAEKKYDWLEDPFNEEKSKKELEEAKRSQNKGLLVVLIVVIVVMLGLFATCNAAAILVGA